MCVNDVVFQRSWLGKCSVTSISAMNVNKFQYHVEYEKKKYSAKMWMF